MIFKFKHSIYSCLALIVFHITALAQEQLMPLSTNVNLNNSYRAPNLNPQAKTTQVLVDTIPFFDDFSYAYKSAYPATNRWLDSSVFVNTGFGIAPLSIGVATFDGLNKKGYPYSIGASVNISTNADTLTSRPINIKQKGTYIYSLADSISLSFYYQPEGNGEAPEAKDSLILEFKNKSLNKWNTVWAHEGYNPSATDTSFKLVMLRLDNIAYLDSAFQFRFRNKATTSGSLDHWNIDYVHLAQRFDRNDTVFSDINFAYKPSSFLKNYSVMPYYQYSQTDMGSNFRNYFRNNKTSNVQMSYKYNMYNNSTNAFIVGNDLLQVGFPNVPPFITGGYLSAATNSTHAYPTLTATPFPVMTDSTVFRVEHIMYGTNDVFATNDTVMHYQKFSNYFAYDDGSAEQGYYINAYGAKTAVKYTLNVADTLKGLKIYFDPIVNGVQIQGSEFRVIVWSDGGSGPGSIIYKDSLRRPIYIQGTNNIIPTYTLTSCLNLPAGSYYFGIQQTTNVGLNIGFDKNTNHKDKMYFDSGSGWTPSNFNGSFMINPLMGCYTPAVVGIKEHTAQHDNLLVYPNPAQNSITISSSKLIDGGTTSITSIIGQTLISLPFQQHQTIDVSALASGVYYVSVADANGQTVSRNKIIITK